MRPYVNPKPPRLSLKGTPKSEALKEPLKGTQKGPRGQEVFLRQLDAHPARLGPAPSEAPKALRHCGTILADYKQDSVCSLS